MPESTPDGGQITPSERVSCSLNDVPVVSLRGLLPFPAFSSCCWQARGSGFSSAIISGGALGNGDTCGDCAFESPGTSTAPNSSAIFHLSK